MGQDGLDGRAPKESAFDLTKLIGKLVHVELYGGRSGTAEVAIIFII